MSKVKYTEEMINSAVELRLAGKTIPEIVSILNIKKPSLQKIFRKRNVKLTPEHKEQALGRRWLNHEPVKNGLKQCSKCEEWKQTSEFHINNQRKTGLVSSCKECYSIFYKQNESKIKERVKIYQNNNPELVKLWDRNRYNKKKNEYIRNAIEWASKNPEKIKEIHREYDKRTQKQKNARTAKYRAIKIQATPSWLSEQQFDEIQRIYINCPPGFHVDHIVPLRGKSVRGLHVPWNLQYLPAEDNVRKSNKW